jgi:hypothetical protein
VLKYPLYKSILIDFHLLFEKVVSGSLKSFFELDNQVKTSVYLTEATALHHSKELAVLAFQTKNSVSFHEWHRLLCWDHPSPN